MTCKLSLTGIWTHVEYGDILSSLSTYICVERLPLIFRSIRRVDIMCCLIEIKVYSIVTYPA